MLKWFKATTPRKILGIAILVILFLALVLGGLYIWFDSMVGKTGELDLTVPTLSSEEEASVLEEVDENEVDPIFDQAEDILALFCLWSHLKGSSGSSSDVPGSLMAAFAPT